MREVGHGARMEGGGGERVGRKKVSGKDRGGDTDRATKRLKLETE